MSISICRVEGSDLYDFTSICGDISLRSSSSEISEELSFSVQGSYLNKGDIISFRENEEEIFKGIVISTNRDKYSTEISCCDFGWYLNKNEDAYQFNSSCSSCISKICNDHNIPIGNIINMPNVYKKIKKGNLSDIIKDIIEYQEKTTGERYIWYMYANKLYVEKQIDNVIKYTTKFNNTLVDVTDLLENPSIDESIDDLYNAIKVVSQEDNSIKVLAYTEDKESIQKYGRIQKLEQVTKEESKNAVSISQGQLKLLNKTSRSFNTRLLGVTGCRANKVLEFDNDIIDVKGKFIIKSCEHTYSKSFHFMNVSLEEL